MDWFPWLLFLHVLGAIVAFGPVFTFVHIAGMGVREPMHANYGLRVSSMLSDRWVLPLAVFQGVTGLLLILVRKIDLTAAGSRWLVFAIVLYAIALSFAIVVQRRNFHRLIELTSGPRPGGVFPGPPPGAAALIASLKRGGLLVYALIASIVLLMVVKPAF